MKVERDKGGEREGQHNVFLFRRPSPSSSRERSDPAVRPEDLIIHNCNTEGERGNTEDSTA